MYKMQKDLKYSRKFDSLTKLLKEIMVNGHNIEYTVKKPRFQFHETIPSQNHAGGIWLLWNLDNVDFNIVVKEYRVMHYTVCEKSTGKQCLLSSMHKPVKG